MATHHPPLAAALRPGRGTALITTRPVAAGEVLLREAPLLLVPESGAAATVCAGCLGYLTPATSAACPSCARVAFCSHACAATASAPPAFHTPAHCAALALAAGHEATLASDTATSLRFLLAVAALQAAAATSPSGSDARAAWAAFESLAAPPNLPAVLAAVPLLAPLLAGLLQATPGGWPAPVPTPDVVSLWLAREAANAFGVLACASQVEAGTAAAGTSSSPGTGCRRSPSLDLTARALRGSGLYATASRLNHDCLPSAARFDGFDHGGDGSSSAATVDPRTRTLLEVRALHDLPAGEEVTLSYFPLDWDLEERSARLAGEYGFTCTCARCALERGGGGGGQQQPLVLRPTHSMPDVGAGRSLRPSDESMAVASGSARESAGSTLPDAAGATVGEAEKPADPAYVAAYLAKFCCAACSGTLAPVVAGGAESDHICNVCGVVRSHAAFLQEMEEEDGWSEDME